MRVFIAATLAALFFLSAAAAQNINNPQTNAAALTSGTLPAGRLPALTGDITSSAGSAATTLAAGSATALNSGTLGAARLPALTGDTTSSAGSAATTTTGINGVSQTAAFTSTTPTPSCAVACTTISSVVKQKIIGKTIVVIVNITVTTVGTGSGTITTAVPTASNQQSACTAMNPDNLSIAVVATISGSNVFMQTSTGVIQAVRYHMQCTYEST